MAIDLQGQAFVFNGTAWSAPHKVNVFGLYSVSCGATYFCVASDLGGGSFVYNGSTWTPVKAISSPNVIHAVSCASATSCVAVDTNQAFRLDIPTDQTTITLLEPAVGANVAGRTIVGAEVSAATAPKGEITLSAGATASAPRCVAQLRAVSAHQSVGHCILTTTHVGTVTIDARFSGSFGFAPAKVASQRLVIVAKKVHA